MNFTYEESLNLCRLNKCIITKFVPQSIEIIIMQEANVSGKFRPNIEFVLQNENVPYWISGEIYIVVVPIETSVKNSFEIKDDDLACTLLNENGIHLLNEGDLYKYPTATTRIKNFVSIVNDGGGKSSDFLLDSTAVLGVYGIRKFGDLDFLSLETEYGYVEKINEIENNYDYVKYHSVESYDLLNNPKYYIPYEGCKLLALDEFIKWKINKGSKKDMEDAKLVELFLARDYKYLNFRRKILFLRILKSTVVNIASTFITIFGLYELFSRKN